MSISFRNGVVAAVVLAAVAAAPAFAQGVDFFPGNAKSPDTDPRQRRQDIPDDRKYEYGKEVWAVKLGCSTCPFGQEPLSESVARRFFSDDSMWSALTDQEYNAVSVYLRQLYSMAAVK